MASTTTMIASRAPSTPGSRALRSLSMTAIRSPYPQTPRRPPSTLTGSVATSDSRRSEARITFADTDDWGSGFIGSVSLTNLQATAMGGWRIEFDLANDITSIWNARIVSHVGTRYVIDTGNELDVNSTDALGYVARHAEPAAIAEILELRLGAVRSGSLWNFASAKTMVLYCNGPWCGQSPTNIRQLLALGYPAHKLKWYRDGMQGWKSLGLPTAPFPAQ